MGLEWLDALEDVIANFQESRITIGSQIARVVLRGDFRIMLWRPSPSIGHEGVIGVRSRLFGSTMACTTKDVCSEIPEEISHVLEANAEVFQTLLELLPHRLHDHAITLKGALIFQI